MDDEQKPPVLSYAGPQIRKPRAPRTSLTPVFGLIVTVCSYFGAVVCSLAFGKSVPVMVAQAMLVCLAAIASGIGAVVGIRQYRQSLGSTSNQVCGCLFGLLNLCLLLFSAMSISSGIAWFFR